jgi:hypothetical protein
MTPAALRAMLAWLLDGAVLRLTEAGGGEYAGGGYAPFPVGPADVSLDGASVEISHVWAFTAPGPDARGCRLTRGDLVIAQGVFDEPFPVPVAGTEVRGEVRIEIKG